MQINSYAYNGFPYFMLNEKYMQISSVESFSLFHAAPKKAEVGRAPLSGICLPSMVSKYTHLSTSPTHWTTSLFT